MADALASLSVLDLTDESGAHATRLLVQLGADVVRVEPIGGDALRGREPFLGDEPGTDRSLWFAYMNAGKRSVTLNLEIEGGAALLARLADEVDVVLYSGPTHRYDELKLAGLVTGRRPLVVTALTPFGLTGPMRSWCANDLIAWAMSGLLFTIGDPDRAPVAPVGELAYVLGSQSAVMGTLAAVRALRRDQIGQLVDVSLQEAVASASGECAPTMFLDDLIPRVRSGGRRWTCAPFGLFPTRDGYASVLALMPGHWLAMREWIHEATGNDAVLDPTFEGGAQSRAGDAWDVVNVFTEDLTRLYTRQELFHEGQRRGIPVAPVNDAASVAEDPQLTARGFWVDVEVDGTPVRAPGPPFRYVDEGASVPPSRRAPRAGEHNVEVYGAVGIDAAERARLAADGVI
jgi:benzylsuccinate CoA-transferase BbsE subunit